MNILKKLLGKKSKPWENNADIDERYDQTKKEEISPNIEHNIAALRHMCGDSSDINIRRITAGKRVPAAIISIDGVAGGAALEEIMRGLMFEGRKLGLFSSDINFFRTALDRLIIVDQVDEVDNFADMFASMAMGDTAILFNGYSKAIMCETTGWDKRDIVEPDAEVTIRGPRDGFTETIRTNTSLIRRRIRVPQLWIKSLEVGKLTRTEVSMVYIKGLASDELVQEVYGRIERIEIDGILESGYIEEFIEDNSYTLLPLLLRTERPDIVCACLLEAKICLLVNGTPHALVIPATFPMFLQAPDDYYEKVPIGSFIRIVRWVAIILSVILPGFYVAVINFHQELLPTDLLLRITETREGVPFPVIAEVLIMDMLFELLREAGIRLPQAIGPAISIVGALILGEAAIRAGLVSPAVVIIIALTAIANFSAPVFSMAIAMRMLRFVYTILGGVFGLFGIQFGILLTCIHLCSLRSFGYPYMEPLAPFVFQDMKDSFIRFWWWGQRLRPKLIGGREPARQKKGQMPSPNQADNKDESNKINKQKGGEG